MKRTILPAIDILRANKNRTPYQQALMEWFEEDMLGTCSFPSVYVQKVLFVMGI